MTSRALSDFLNFIKDADTQYGLCYEDLTKQNKLQEDLLHAIEFCKDKKERNRLATQLARCRKDRRWFKNRVEELEPIVQFLGDYNNKKTIEALRNILGRVRKQEEYHAKRAYFPRSLSPEMQKFFSTEQRKEGKE